MRMDEKERIQDSTRKKYWWIRLKYGINTLMSSRKHQMAFVIFIAAMFALSFQWLYDYITFVNRLEQSATTLAVFYGLPIAVYTAITLAVIMLIGTPKEYIRFRNEFLRIGLVNSASECPVLIKKFTDDKYPLASVYEFLTLGIPISEWESRKAKIESALNVYIVKVSEGQGKKTVKLYAVSADNQLPSKLVWDDKYMVDDTSTLVMGRNHLGDVTVNIAKIPHILLGGSTGSGKSVLLKLLLMQAIKKNIVVTIADFKGGVDFPPIWHKKCNICTDEEELLQILTALVEALKSRKLILKESGCANIDEYNKKTGNNLQRFIFACDEIAEVLDKTGLTKEQKELVTKIESKLSVIARQGRAFGIHLILATQRPDATILSGQIRNNIDCRACGRADTVLSQIILDSPAAAEQIPKDAAGRFILHDETVFQAYMFDDSKF